MASGTTLISSNSTPKVCILAKWPMRLELIWLSVARIKRLGVFLTLSGWDANPSHGYPQH